MTGIAWTFLTSRAGLVLIASGAILALYLLWQDADDARQAAEARAMVAERAAEALADQMHSDAQITDAIDSIREDIQDDPSNPLSDDLSGFLDRLRERRPAAGGASGTD